MIRNTDLNHKGTKTPSILGVLVSSWLAIFSLSIPSSRVIAQTDAPPAGRTGTVTGQIVSGTSGGGVPGGAAVILHAWDQSGETVMLDGTADSSGAFRFDDVPLQDGWTFGAMLTYNDVTFFSDFVEVKPETSELVLPLTIYETTPDASSVRISQLHTFLDFAPGEVAVSEIYILSNGSDRAVVGGTTLADGRTATLEFALPPGANKVSFKGDDSGGRFLITPEGFADTGAVQPGEGATQIIVSYTLPYSSGMAVAHQVNYPAEAVNVLIRSDSGVTLAGERLGQPTPRQMGNGETFNIYPAGPLAPGDALQVTLTGQPVIRAAGGTMAEPQRSALNALADRWAIPIGGGILGAAMIAFGVWWWRRGATPPAEPEAESDPESEWPNVLRAIADLDAARERGEVAEEAYRSRRAELRAKARAILQAREGAK